MNYHLDKTMYLLYLIACICIFSLGCTTSTHEEEHADHEIPEHRPRDFPHAVKRIRHRFNQFSMSLEVRDEALAARKFKELHDIVRWLPELAGESDLPEEEWNEVQRISHTLERNLVPLVKQLPKLDAPTWKTFTTAQESTLTELDKLSNHSVFKVALLENEK